MDWRPSPEGVRDNLYSNVIWGVIGLLGTAMLVTWVWMREAVSPPILVALTIGFFGVIMLAINQAVTFFRRGFNVRHKLAEIEQRVGKLEKDNENFQVPSPVSLSEVFTIEHLGHTVRLRDKGGAMLGRLREEMSSAPNDATFVVEVTIKITSIPARIVEDVVLSVVGRKIYLHPGDWRRHQVGLYESYLSYDIPLDIQPAYHKMHLIMEGEGGMEVKSAVFRVTLTRSYSPATEGQ